MVKPIYTEFGSFNRNDPELVELDKHLWSTFSELFEKYGATYSVDELELLIIRNVTACSTEKRLLKAAEKWRKEYANRTKDIDGIPD